MANPTTYFGWVMPTSTDLVTDLPADFNVFGQGVDTSLQYLLGGTTGQVLSKTSNTNMAFTWITPQVGDITAVTAGTGISGGGTSGAVTVSIDTAITADLSTAQTLTNKTLTSPVLTTPSISNINAKGDLLAGTADNTIGTLGVGTNGQVLTADSAEATGLKWATASSSPTYAGVSLKRASGSVGPSNATWTVVPWPAEDFDTDAYHDNTTNNSRITIPAGKAGKYSVTGFGMWDPNTSGSARYISIYKNGVSVKVVDITPSAAYPSSFIQMVLNLAVSDYVQLYVYQDSGGPRDFFNEEPYGHFSASFLGA